MSHNQEQFESLNERNGQNIYLGDNSHLEVKGSGNVQVRNGIFKNVKLVPQLSTNLLSVFQIANQEYKIEFYNDKCLVKDVNNNYKVVAIGKVENGLYKFQEFIENKDVCAIAKYDDVSRLWHELMGHINYQSLKLMEKLNLVYVKDVQWVNNI